MRSGAGRIVFLVVALGLQALLAGTGLYAQNDGSLCGRDAAAVVGGGSVPIVLGDFNGDGILDLALANFCANSVSVSLGNGDGTFQMAQDFAVGVHPVALLVSA